MSDPDLDTPIGIENALKRLITSLTQAQRELANARDTAVMAELDYKSARRRHLLSDEAPVVARNSTTVDERNAWVEAKCEDEERTWRIADAARDAAQDRLRILRDDVTLLVTLSSSIRTSYEVAGRVA